MSKNRPKSKKCQPLDFASWRETEEAWLIDDGEDDATDRLCQAYADYEASFPG